MKYKIKVNAEPSAEDELTTKLFQEAVKAAIKKNKLLGVPIARYDGRRKLAYLEYPDKSRVYYERTKK